MRYAICVATPLQMLNAINLVCNSLDACDSKDLFYENFSSEMNRILDKVKEYGLFNHIYEFSRLRNKNKKFKYYFNCLTQAIAPEKFIRDSLKSGSDFEKGVYDVITVSSGTPMEVALKRLHPDAQLIAFEDGLGSYVGNIVRDNDRHKIIWWIFGRRRDKIMPECLYVNNVSFCESTFAPCLKELCPLSSCGQTYRDMIFDIFDFRPNKMYRERPLIYLSQPMDELGIDMLGRTCEIENILAKYESKGVYRKHPRDVYKTKLNYWIDEKPCVWELLCNSEISDDNILLGFCSTAQISPKILYNKEPWIIFTYKLFHYENSKICNNRLKPIADQIKRTYKRKDKILEPTTLEELQKILDYLLE